MTTYTVILLIQIAWGVLFFTLGVLVGYMLKVVMTNYERMKARKE